MSNPQSRNLKYPRIYFVTVEHFSMLWELQSEPTPRSPGSSIAWRVHVTAATPNPQKGHINDPEALKLAAFLVLQKKYFSACTL